MEQSIISSDSHVIEVPDLWEKGMPSSFRERAPKAFFDEKRDAWMFGSPEVPIQAVGGLFMAGQQPEQLEKFRGRVLPWRVPAAGIPSNAKDMVTDGVAAEVLYPSLGLGLYCVEDAALQEALFELITIGSSITAESAGSAVRYRADFHVSTSIMRSPRWSVARKQAASSAR